MKILWQLFASFFKIGLFTIGGGMAMLPFIYRVVVDEKSWLSEQEMTDCIAVSQSLPGVIAINSATYVGARKAGLPGALAASAGVVLPSFTLIISIVSFLGVVGDNRYIDGAMNAVKAASCGLILYAAYRLSRQIARGWLPISLAALSFILIAAFGISAVWVVLVGIFAGWGTCFFAEKKATKQ